MICTFPADPGECELAALNLTAGVFFCRRTQARQIGHPAQVLNTSALGADEVDMGVGVPVKALHAFDRSHADDQPLLLKQSQVPVHRAQGKIGDLGLQLGVYPVG